MARERKTANVKEDFVKVTSYKVTRANEFKENRIFFDLVLNGVTIYGCMVVGYKDGEFISFPSQKSAKDGNYYNVVYAKLSNEDQKKIIDSVYELLDK